MGVSTDAILFYGLVIDDGSDLHGKILEDYRGGEDGEPVEGSLAWLWYTGEEAEGCVVDVHCSDEYPMFYIAVAASRITAWRGRPKLVISTAHGPGWQEKLMAFCRRFGVEPEGIGWWLVSYWG